MARLIDDLDSYFENHVDDLLKKYDGKFLVISKDMEVNPFQTYDEASHFAMSAYGYGNYLLKECSSSAIHAVHVINPIITVS